MAGPPRKHWDQRIAVARELLQQAEREGREVLILETAPSPDDRVELRPMSRPRRARSPAGLAAAPVAGRPGGRARGAGRRPRASSRRAAIWLSDGIALGAQGQADAERLGEALRLLGPLQVRADAVADLPIGAAASASPALPT